MKIYLVGGSVRDYLLGIPSKDRDYMVETSFANLKDLIINSGYEILHEKPEFLTLRVKVEKEVVDFACCRTEGDYDGRRPGFVAETSLEYDLNRRDFTVNAMAIECDQELNPVGEIVDLHGGQSDLRNKLLRFVGDPQERLKEDGLRWLRALRFIITKDFKANAPLGHLLKNPPENLLDRVSVERIREELERCFKHNTYETICYLAKMPEIWIKDGLWLKPTTEK